VAPNAKGEILHEQGQYWGRKGVHYHQFLAAGENTLNMQLALQLLESLRVRGGYDRADYLRRYVEFMTTPRRHRDTYLEECHRNFFTRYARGTKPEDCGSEDIHIGGLAQVPVLAVWYADDEAAALAAVREHVRVTHRGELVETAARDLTRMLVAMMNGAGVRESIEKFGNGWAGRKKFEGWAQRPDEEVIGGILSPACYLEDSFPASLYLAWKYADDLEAALVVNANLGGDNCHRGIVVGALVGAGGLLQLADRDVQRHHRILAGGGQLLRIRRHLRLHAGQRGQTHQQQDQKRQQRNRNQQREALLSFFSGRAKGGVSLHTTVSSVKRGRLSDAPPASSSRGTGSRT
jgi:ADP-ribosylglycohydrolase